MISILFNLIGQMNWIIECIYIFFHTFGMQKYLQVYSFHRGAKRRDERCVMYISIPRVSSSVYRRWMKPSILQLLISLTSLSSQRFALRWKIALRQGNWKSSLPDPTWNKISFYERLELYIRWKIIFIGRLE